MLVLLVFGIIIGIVTFEAHSKTNNSANQNTSISGNSTEIAPGAFSAPACPIPIYKIYNRITGTTGLRVFNLSGIIDYVINPGNSGEIRYVVYVGNSTVLNQSTTINATNIVSLYHASSDNQTLNTSYGISMSSDPVDDFLVSNSNHSIVVTIVAEPNATEGTYWMSLGPGFCLDGPVALLTIGNGPFSGPVKGYPIPIP